MKKSELKEIIKSQFLAEAEDSKKGNKEEQKRMEGAIRDDRDHIKDLEKDIKDNEAKLAKLKKDEPKDVSEGEDVSEGDKYYEDKVDEAEEVDVEDNEDIDVEDNEDINVDVERDVDVDDESSKSEIEVDSELAGESSDTAAVLGLLTKAQEKASAMGDEKLMDQIGNTITYYTRAHVVASTNEELELEELELEEAKKEELDESLSRFKKLAGLIK
ncbi:MAG: hypothetical protein CMJ25_04855 [Phycisphaerae bacterium]|nr:hypothetical protein [Phycisphaerae bacterium]|tara:strand:- start:155 stop:802 length:648 start_codon:yes stop_codon:yes gene_type:complete